METAKRKRRGERARYPRRRRALVPLRYYAGTFRLDGRRVRLSVSRHAPELWLRLARAVPYRPEQVRSVTLLVDAGRLVLDVTAEVPIEATPVKGNHVAGVDLGIIHPFAVASASSALLVSGRAIRAEERLHLADTKARSRAMSHKAPRRGQRGSRRWRKLRRAQRSAEARHRRRVRQAHHEAAASVVAWALRQGVATLVVGDPKGIARRDAGRFQNRRVAGTWRRTHLLGSLADKAELAGITVLRIDERGTSSTCPECRARTAKPRGRRFACSSCGYRGHRDLVGARNIAARGGGTTTARAVVTHRRAGTVPVRRDRRRHLMDRRRSCPAPGRPKHGESLVGARPRHGEDELVSLDHRRGSDNVASVA
jgi:transposase